MVLGLCAALGAVVAGSAIVAAHAAPFWGDVGGVESFNGLPRAVGVPLEGLMQLGTLGGAMVVTALVVAMTAGRGWGPVATVAVAAALASVLDDVVKDLVERPRPPGVVPGLTVREEAAGFAFPSGHTTMAFALATAVAPVVPRPWRPVLYAVATATAVARLYVGVHWPTDLIGGAALGVAIGLTARLLVGFATPGDRPDADYGRQRS